MQSNRLFLAIAILLNFFYFSLVFNPVSAVAQEVDIPDPNLRAKIEEALGKGAGDIITAADMETLTELNAPRIGITDLTGIEFAANLTTLNLSFNDIEDLSPISALTSLHELYFTDSHASDVSPFVNLTNLKILDLGAAHDISDISPLAGLTNLTSLSVWRWGERGDISDISVVANFPHLTHLYLGGHQISDISVLAGLTDLTRLGLFGNNISDISLLAGLTNLTWLHLWDNSISDISAVAGLVNLTEIKLDGNPIADTSPLCPLIERNPNLKVDIEIDCELLVGVSADTDLIHIPLGAVKATALLQNFPNPFNPETWIPYLLADDAFVTLTIHNESGGLVRSFDVGYQRAGVYQNRSRAVYWDGRNESGEPVGSGVYFYQLDTGDYSKTRKMLILK